MVIDNCPAHPNITGLKAIDLIFLPPNTTSHTQPMDQGIIANFKHHYRTSLLRQLIASIDKDLTLSVLQAMHSMAQAWSQVKQSTIANCFAHCGFKITHQPQPEVDPEEYIPLATLQPEVDSEDNIPLATLMSQIKRAGFEVNSTAADYMTVDDQLVTTEPLTDESIITHVKQPSLVATPESDDESDDDSSLPPKPASHTDFLAACELQRCYLQSYPNTQKYFPYMSIPLNNFLYITSIKVKLSL